MKFGKAIDLYIDDMRSSGRINSDRTERTYRSVLEQHLEDVGNRDPSLTGREDVKRTLRRWTNPNTQRVRRAALVSFYDWAMEEGYRPTNPARQTRRPKPRKTEVYRLTLDEVQAMLAATETLHELRAIRIGVCAGLRNQELRGLQGRHFRRPGFIWVSSDIAKGGRERWVPVIPDLQAVWEEVHRHVKDSEYVLPALRWRNPGLNTERKQLNTRAMSAQALYYLVGRVAQRAGIRAHVHPHLLRHAYGDHIAKRAGLLVAQAVLGHASVETTRGTYVGRVTLDDLAKAISGFTFAAGGLSPDGTPVIARSLPIGLEPVDSALRSTARRLGLQMLAMKESFASAV